MGGVGEVQDTAPKTEVGAHTWCSGAPFVDWALLCTPSTHSTYPPRNEQPFNCIIRMSFHNPMYFSAAARMGDDWPDQLHNASARMGWRYFNSTGPQPGKKSPKSHLVLDVMVVNLLLLFSVILKKLWNGYVLPGEIFTIMFNYERI